MTGKPPVAPRRPSCRLSKGRFNSSDSGSGAKNWAQKALEGGHLQPSGFQLEGSIVFKTTNPQLRGKGRVVTDSALPDSYPRGGGLHHAAHATHSTVHAATRH